LIAHIKFIFLLAYYRNKPIADLGYAIGSTYGSI